MGRVLPVGKHFSLVVLANMLSACTYVFGGPIVHTEYGPVEGVEKLDGVKVFHGVGTH